MHARFGFSIMCGVGAASLILPLAACAPPTGSGFVGDLSDLLDDADPIDTFDGDWLSEEFGYAVRITDRVGVATLTDTTAYRVGDEMLVLLSVDGEKFDGRQIFADGSVQSVIGRLTDPLTIAMFGAGLSWDIQRISPLNLAPEVTAGVDQVIPLNQGLGELLGIARDDLTPDDELLFTWTLREGPGDIEIADAGAIITTFTFDQAGTYIFDLEVDDGARTSTDSVAITVNTPPTAQAGEDQVVGGGDEIALDGSSSADPDEADSLTYRWRQLAGPEVTIENFARAEASFIAPDPPAELRFALVVTDSRGESASDEVTIIVTVLTDNSPPLADAGSDRNVVVGLVVTLDASGSIDPDGDSLSFSWDQTAGPDVAIEDVNTGRATFTVPDGAETLSFTLVARDELSGLDTATVTLTVVAEPHVRLSTSLGEVVMEILFEDAPVTSLNFLRYVDEGFYDGTVFHRIVPDFVVQGGGFLPDMQEQESVRDPIVNEFSAERSNLRATVAMAKVGDDPDSATSEFFFNLADNSENLDNQNGGFTVFARVVEGMEIVDAMADVELDGETPIEDILLETATIE